MASEIPTEQSTSQAEVDYPQALQIIATDEPGHENEFMLKEENLEKIVNKIPSGMKVSVVSVVGAFRTGKSFLLNFFIRYLTNAVEGDLSQAWMKSKVSEAEGVGSGSGQDWNLVEKETEGTAKVGNFFKWAGGQARSTTGIWMWSEPFIRTLSNGDRVAVLLMDTQGMFDHDTTMMLTAQIFGLSTLISSFEIYNLEKRIQEDNLQHLALFSEYGRLALQPQKNEKMQDLLDKVKGNALLEELAKEQKEGPGEKAEQGTSASNEATNVEDASTIAKPFQRLQFLIRDFQSFPEDLEELILERDPNIADPHTKEILQREREEYLSKVIQTEKKPGELQFTREQIIRCFDQVDCFFFPHPGLNVTKKNYDGKISTIDPFFLALLNHYVRKVFDEELTPKAVNGVEVTGKELLLFIKIYTDMFKNNSNEFPEAKTVLQATAEGNSQMAVDRAVQFFTTFFDSKSSFIPPAKFTAELEEKKEMALRTFQSIANMGLPGMIEKYKQQLTDMIEEQKQRYITMNDLRNPFRVLELYLIPIAAAVVAWIMSILVDRSCSTDFCERVEDTFVNVYLFILVVGLYLFRNYVYQYCEYMKAFIWPRLVEQVDGFKNNYQQQGNSSGNTTTSNSNNNYATTSRPAALNRSNSTPIQRNNSTSAPLMRQSSM